MDARVQSEADLLESLLDNLPDVGSERERCFLQAAHRLRAFVGGKGGPLPPGIENLSLRLTRDALLDLYFGFRSGTFRGISRIPRAPGEPPIAQTRLRKRLEALACVEIARAEMFRWFLAGLHHELGQTLDEWLHTVSLTWGPRRLFTRWSGQLALALEQTFRTPVNDQDPEHEFGLYGLHLLFAGTGEISLYEFQALDGLMTRWVEEYSDFPDHEIRDLVPTMALSSLTTEQVQVLVNRLGSWHELNNFPAKRSFRNRREEIRAKAREMGYGQTMTRLAVFLALLFRLRSSPNRFGEEYQHDRDTINRYWHLASALAGLALQAEDCLPALVRRIDELLKMKARVETNSVLMDALPAFLAHPAHLPLLLETLARHGFHELDNAWIDNLRDLRLQVSQDAMETLLELRRRRPAVRWPLQILEHAGELTPQAEDWLGQQAQDNWDDRLIEIILALRKHTSAFPWSSFRLDSVLRQRLKRCLKDDLPIPDDLVCWVLYQPDEALRRLFLDLAHELTSASPQVTHSIFAFLCALAIEASHTERLDPIKLAACWLVDPEDGLNSRLHLPERLTRAAKFLSHGRFDAEIATLLIGVVPQKNSAHPRLDSVLLEPVGYHQEYPMRAGADRRLALTRALSQSSSLEHALPLLDDLSQLVVELYIGWYTTHYFPELRFESNALAIGTLEAVAQLEPVVPQGVTLLEKMLLAQYELPEGGYDTALSLGVITEEVLSLLVDRRLTHEAIPVLVELLEHKYPVEEVHRQRIWMCALQWLSNTSAVSSEEQEIIWKVGYASPSMYTRSLALLALGRQRPLGQRTWETVLGLLHRPWLRLYQKRSWEIMRLGDRSAWHICPGDAFLLPGVAVALTAEWMAETRLLNNEQKKAVTQAWSRASSIWNRILEAHLAENIGVPRAPSIARTLCGAANKSPDDDPSWLNRPADLARGLLLTT